MAHHQEFRDKVNERERKKGRKQASARKYYGRNAERLRAQSRDEQRPAVAGRVVDLFPPNTRGLTCLYVGAAESHWPMPSPDEFAHGEHVMLEEDRVHALLEPPEDHPLAAARGVLVGGLLGFLLWLIAVSVLLAARAYPRIVALCRRVGARPYSWFQGVARTCARGSPL